LPPLIERISNACRELEARYECVVVDDGSRDSTSEVLAKLCESQPIHVIRHKLNRGLGETARDGFEYVAEVGGPDDVLIRMDCDDTHDPKYFRPMIAKLNEGYEVVTTSRYARGGGQEGVDAYRRFISRCANLLMKTVFPIRGVKEYTCGYRAYRVSFIQDAIGTYGNSFLDLKGMGFTGTVEKIIKARMMRAAVAEVPFTLRYDMKQGGSKVVTSLTTLGYLVLIAKYIYPWGDLGAKWRAEAIERRRRLYPNGRLDRPSVRID
jgi:dolichol-phosphate mannosyltransferase